MDIFIVYGRRNHGDIDNICKSILDGLNEIAWKDDRQVKQLGAVLVVDKTQEERVDVSIRSVWEGDLIARAVVVAGRDVSS